MIHISAVPPPTFINPLEYRKKTGGPSLRGHILLTADRSGYELAKKIHERYNEWLGDIDPKYQLKFFTPLAGTFPDGEIEIRNHDSVRGRDVFIVQQTYDPKDDIDVNANIMEFLLYASSIKRHKAKNITAVIPYLPYMRQEREKFSKHQPVSAGVIAKFMRTVRVDDVITGRVHSEVISSMYDMVNISVDELNFLPAYVDHYLPFKGKSNVAIVCPDRGSIDYNKIVARNLDLRLIVALKTRRSSTEIEDVTIIGDMTGIDTIIIIDDIISSAGTVEAIIKKLHDISKIREVHIAANHGVFSDLALPRLENLRTNYHLKELLITDSIRQPAEVLAFPNLKVLSMVDSLALAINVCHYEASLNKTFIDHLKID